MPRPLQLAPRERLLAALHRLGHVGAVDLARELEVSRPTLLRMLQEQANAIVTGGEARRRRYAARRALRGDEGPWPIYTIDRAGRAQPAGELALVQPQGSHCELDEATWPVPAESRDGWWVGLPYPIVDMRPQGFMGRRFARQNADTLRLDPDPRQWSDDDTLLALVSAGADQLGDLVIGQQALAQWQRASSHEPIREDVRGDAYLELASRALTGSQGASSAGGEFPKFIASRERTGSLTPHVIVKFSGSEDSAAVRRWSDLLVCEHLALESAAGELGMSASRSEIIQVGGRTFLEVERFDRHGARGRSPVASLETIDGAFLGSSSTRWPELAESLALAGMLSWDDVARVETLWWFGRQIRNSDMHLGNLSFVPIGGGFALAPVYDMLPMHYAPLAGGEVPPREFDAPLPFPHEALAWRRAWPAAVAYWRRCAQDDRISEAFRATCADNAQQLIAQCDLLDGDGDLPDMRRERMTG